MRKSKVIAISISALIALYALTACATNSKKTDAEESGSHPEAGMQTAAMSERESGSETASEAADDEGSDAEAEIDYREIAYELFGAIDYIDRIGGTALPYDETVSYSEGDVVFYKVDKTQFSSVADIKEYMESHLTADMISKRYSAILDSEPPYYIDHDGELYVRPAPKGCGFAYYQEDNEPVISDKSESSFTAQMNYDDYGGTAVLEISAVKENDFWKIDGIGFE